jgi:tungstate transport system ATP-binding protein
MKPLLRATNISKGFDGKPILDNINLKVEKGGRLAVVGPNGSGKTTLIRILNLLEPPTTGEVYFNGVNILNASDKWSIRRKMALVFQRPPVFNLNVYENIAVGLRVRGMNRSDASIKVQEVMELFRITELEKKIAKKLSGGEKQLLALASAVALEPELLLLDEPTSTLDPENTAIVDRVLKNTKSAIIITSPTPSFSSDYDKTILL